MSIYDASSLSKLAAHFKHQMDNSSPNSHFHNVCKPTHGSKLALPPESFLTGRGLMPPSGSALTRSSEINDKLTPISYVVDFTKKYKHQHIYGVCFFFCIGFSCVGGLFFCFFDKKWRLIHYQRVVVGVVGVLVWLEGPEDEEEVGV